MSLFATSGYAQTRMADVAARVGVTEPVVFQNFGTKADLFAAALDRVGEDAVGYVSAMAGEYADVRDWLGHLLASEHLDRLHTAPKFGVLFADAHRLHSEVSIGRAVHRCVTRVAEAIAVVLRRGQVEVSIRADVPPATLAWLVLSLIKARELRRSHSPEPSPVLEDDFLASILATVAPRPHDRR
ncbi:MAG: TetR/AcrR family transcriptional regulator [Chloroflexi bacterium]|nr:TetR/AcrR family transcriptional regulator [Chloroflexota bacterium]